MTLQPGHCLSMYSENCNKDYVHDFARCNVLLVHNSYYLLSYHHLKICCVLAVQNCHAEIAPWQVLALQGVWKSGFLLEGVKYI